MPMGTNDSSNHRSAFRQIMKGTAIFGGTQVITMLTNIVRGKLVAMILGAYGMGVTSLLNSAIQPVQQLFSCGLPMASVSSIANAADDKERAQRTIAFRRCLTILSILACIFVIASSSLLCKWTFGNTDHSSWFAGLGLAVLFLMLSTGESAILQSHRALKQLAKCNILAPMLGLVLGVPMYFIWGVGGIVPAMILLAFITWAYSRWNTRGLGIRASQSWRETLTYGRGMMMLGATMMVAGLIGNLSVYLINTFINGNGSTDDVGFYQSANTITTQCTAMVFTALATDFYPHLTQVAKDFKAMTRLINQEGEIVLLVTAPVAALLIVCSPIVVRLLLTSEFDCIVPIVQMMSLAFLMRAYYFPLDYICLAKGDKTYYFCMEGIWANVKMLVIFIGGYRLWGLIGLGYAAVLNAVVDIIVSTVLVRWRYNIVYGGRMLLMSAFLILLASSTMLASLVGEGWISYVVSSALVAVIIAYSLVQLNKRISIVDAVRNRLHRRE